MDSPLISVIVPVYNVEQYLDECIKSIVEQSYQNLEIILVNDGSTDSGGSICDVWATKDTRIQVIHKENGGLSDARNAGLKVAKGELIGFVDSDDVLATRMYEILYQSMIYHDADITCCPLMPRTHFDDSLNDIKESCICQMYSPEEALAAILDDQPISVTVMNKLYKKSLMEGIEFVYGKLHEDEFWSYQVFARAEKIGMVEQPLYGYRQRENSIMHTKYSLRRLDLLDARRERLTFVEERFPNLAASARCDLRFTCIRAYQFCLMGLKGEELKAGKIRIRDVVRSYHLRYEDYRILPFGRRVWCFLSNLSFGGTCRIRNRFHYGP